MSADSVGDSPDVCASFCFDPFGKLICNVEIELIIISMPHKRSARLEIVRPVLLKAIKDSPMWVGQKERLSSEWAKQGNELSGATDEACIALRSL